MSDDREKQNKKTLQTSKNGLQRCFLASLGRFELPAFRLGGERSILLSYKDIENIGWKPRQRMFPPRYKKCCGQPFAAKMLT